MISTPPFPEILVINLDHRSDRWTTIAERCARAGLQPNRVSAVVEKPGWKGCGRSHVRCVEIAKERGLPWVLIIEDDALFSPESIGRFRSLLPHLWQNRDKWERFSGGPNLPPRIIPKPVIRIMSQEHRLLYVRGLAAHFNLIHAGAYDAVLRWDPRIDRMIDVYFMALETHPRTIFNSIATVPFIATQEPGVSDVDARGNVDYTRVFRFSEQKLSQFLDAGEPTWKRPRPASRWFKNPAVRLIRLWRARKAKWRVGNRWL
jgi:hypothetical protein